MKSVLEKDKKRRKLFKKYEIRKKIMKSILSSDNLKLSEKNFLNFLLKKYPKNSSLVRIRNRCIITGRPNAVFRKYRLSRIMLKKKILEGYISGFVKF